MSGPELEASQQPDRWRLWTGEQGTIAQRSWWDESYRRSIEMRHLYTDDAEQGDPPDEHPGQRGALYERARVDDIEPGLYRGMLEWYFPGWPSYEPGAEAEILAVHDDPLEVKLGAWTGPALDLREDFRP